VLLSGWGLFVDLSVVCDKLKCFVIFISYG
jgi:hypothetical protein